MSSLFPRAIFSERDSLADSLFPFIDQLERYHVNRDRNHQRSGTMKLFVPNFDVKEVGEHYELHGELPGVDQKDVEIEFTDSSTLNIKGRTARSVEYDSDGSKKATVEDEEATEGNKENTQAGETSTDITKAPEKSLAETRAKPKYWVSERSVGEFARTFTFPVPVDQDAVKATMKDGILAIIVPKTTKSQSCKIKIT